MLLVRMTLGNLNVVMPWPEQHIFLLPFSWNPWLPPCAIVPVVLAV